MFHPFVFVPLALAVWLFVAGLFHPVPGIGIFGAPETEEGVLWFLDFAVFTAAAIILGRFRAPRIILLLVAFIAVIVISGLTWGEEIYCRLFIKFSKLIFCRGGVGYGR